MSHDGLIEHDTIFVGRKVVHVIEAAVSSPESVQNLPYATYYPATTRKIVHMRAHTHLGCPDLETG